MKRWQIIAIGLIGLSLVYWPAVAIILVAAGLIVPLLLLIRAMRQK